MLLLLLLTVAALSHVTQGATFINKVNFGQCTGRFGNGFLISQAFLLKDATKNYVSFRTPTVNDNNPYFELDLMNVDVMTETTIEAEGDTNCKVKLHLKRGQEEVLVLEFSDGVFTATSKTKDMDLSFKIPVEKKEFKWSLTKDVPTTYNFLGCIKSGNRFVAGDTYCGDDNEVMRCDAQGNPTGTPCLMCSKGKCMAEPICTVTGSTVITFTKTQLTISDRCGYALLAQERVLNLAAVFKERRRKDVSLLDHLLLTVGASSIQIKTGRVKLGDSEVDLDKAMPETMPKGITISKTPKGIKVEYKDKFELLFDGNSAVIHVTGLSYTTLTGSCKTSAVKLKPGEHPLSPKGCDQKQTEVKDESINCETAKAHCDLLDGELFSSCHSTVSPKLYIAACHETMCKYPSVDGIACSFHKAYTAACSIMSKEVTGWKNSAKCGSAGDKCMDIYCSDHEFCGNHLTEDKCLCRALFALKYPKTLGEPTVCSKNSASLSLATCLLAAKGVHYEELHLNDKTCKGQMDPDTHLLNFGFSSEKTCGTDIKKEDSKIFYKNKVVLAEQSNDLVTRQDQFQVDFSCSYSQPEVKTVALKIKSSSVVQKIDSGDWSYTLTMKAYLDSARTKPVNEKSEIQLDQTVWVELSTVGLDEKMVSIVTDSCWATKVQKTDSQPKYDLVTKSCANPKDKSVKVHGNGVGTSNYFAFNMFQFTGDSSDVYLHCKVSLCVTKENACVPKCDGNRRRRSVYYDPNPGLVSMSWAK